MTQILQLSKDDLREQMTIIYQDIQANEARKAAENAKKTMLLTPAEVCDMLKISKPTLWRWEQRGFIKPRMVGDQKRYAYSDIQEIANGK